MQLTTRTVIRDEAGLIDRTVDLIRDKADLAADAVRTADAALLACRRAIIAADQADDPDAFTDAVARAQSWATVRAVAAGDYPGTLVLDERGEVVGVDVQRAPTVNLNLH